MARKVGEHLIGKLGPVVTSFTNGKEVTKIYNPEINDAFSIPQRIQRSKVKFASRFIRTLKNIIQVGYQATTKDNPYNEAKSFICINCFSVQSTNITVLYENILVSRGLLAKADNCTLSFAGDSFTISWEIPDRKSRISGDDMVNLVMYTDVSDGQQWNKIFAAKRRDGTLTGQIPKSDLPVHFWIFFHNGDLTAKPSRNNISDSLYLGTYPQDCERQIINALTYVEKKKKK